VSWLSGIPISFLLLVEGSVESSTDLRAFHGSLIESVDWARGPLVLFEPELDLEVVSS
jgi:hypothetical protein